MYVRYVCMYVCINVLSLLLYDVIKILLHVYVLQYISALSEDLFFAE